MHVQHTLAHTHLQSHTYAHTHSHTLTHVFCTFYNEWFFCLLFIGFWLLMSSVQRVVICF